MNIKRKDAFDSAIPRFESWRASQVSRCFQSQAAVIIVPASQDRPGPPRAAVALWALGGDPASGRADPVTMLGIAAGSVWPAWRYAAEETIDEGASGGRSAKHTVPVSVPAIGTNR